MDERKGKSSSSDFRDSAAQRIAIESFKNIANVNIGSVTGGDVKVDGDPDVERVVSLLKKYDTPLYVYDVADRLGWDSDRAAEALSHGGAEGRLDFFAENGRTMVQLAKVAS